MSDNPEESWRSPIDNQKKESDIQQEQIRVTSSQQSIDDDKRTELKYFQERCELLKKIKDQSVLLQCDKDTPKQCEQIKDILDQYMTAYIHLLKKHCLYFSDKQQSKTVDFCLQELQKLSEIDSMQDKVSDFINKHKHLTDQDKLRLESDTEKLLESLPNNKLQYEVISGLSVHHAKSFNVQQCIDHIDESWKLADKLEDDDSRYSCEIRKGFLASILGKYRPSYEFYKPLLTKDVKCPRTHTILYVNLSVVLLLLAKKDQELKKKSLSYAMKSLQLSRQYEDLENMSLSHGNIGLASLKLRNYECALRNFQQCLQLGIDTKDDRIINNSYCNLGRTFKKMKKLDKAKEFFEKAVTMKEPPNSHWCDTENMRFSGDYQLAKMHIDSGGFDEAEVYLRKAIERCESQRRSVQDSSAKIIFNDTQRKPYQYMQDVLLHQKKTEEALLMSEKGRARDFYDKVIGEQNGMKTSEEIVAFVKKQKVAVLVLSTLQVVKKLCTWFIWPDGSIHVSTIELDDEWQKIFDTKLCVQIHMLNNTVPSGVQKTKQSVIMQETNVSGPTTDETNHDDTTRVTITERNRDTALSTTTNDNEYATRLEMTIEPNQDKVGSNADETIDNTSDLATMGDFVDSTARLTMNPDTITCTADKNTCTTTVEELDQGTSAAITEETSVTTTASTQHESNKMATIEELDQSPSGSARDGIQINNVFTTHETNQSLSGSTTDVGNDEVNLDDSKDDETEYRGVALPSNFFPDYKDDIIVPEIHFNKDDRAVLNQICCPSTSTRLGCGEVDNHDVCHVVEMLTEQKESTSEKTPENDNIPPPFPYATGGCEPLLQGNSRGPGSTKAEGSSGMSDELCDLIDKLSTLIVEPIQSCLDGLIAQNEDGKPTLVIMPQMQTFNIPFAALKLRGEPLCKKMTILEEYSFHSFAHAVDQLHHTPTIESQTPPNILIVGNPTEDLNSAQMEAQLIGRLLHVDPLLGRDSTKEEILKRLRDVSIAHFACHGSRDGKRLLLAKVGGVQTYLDVDDIPIALKNIKLVVLSACHTHRGTLSSEGVQGLARAFQMAGVKSVVTSLWAIKDKATERFMQSFYSKLHEGWLVANALSETMSDMQETQRFRDVKYWAPFKVLGANCRIF